MATLGQLCDAAAAMLGIEDSERAATQLRLCARQAVVANRTRELFWNVKETTITPLVVDQFVYAQGATTSDLPQDWIAAASYLDHNGDPTAWITTTDDTNTKFEFLWVSPGEYRRKLAALSGTSDRPRYWTMINESLYLVPAADVTTYIITLAYIYDADKSFVATINTDGSWGGSNDSYTSDWYVEGKGYNFLLEEVVRRMQRGPMRELQESQGAAQGAAEQLLSLTSMAEKNVMKGRRGIHW